jgi:GTPase
LFFERPEAGRRAVLLHLNLKRAAIDAPDDPDECVELARSAGIDVACAVTGSRDTPHPRWFVGEGKLEELSRCLAEAGADLLIVNHSLSPAQQRNLEQHLGCRAMSRTELILHIFADRARTYEGKLQVELAQLRHAQTRLVRGWTHLDRQKGGIGLRGVGETQLELDQRMLNDRIRGVEKKLDSVARRRGQGRRRRQRGHVRTVSLVGYTNAGKSTLFNALTAANVTSEDRLFATLDPTMRQLHVPGVGEVVLADTVGFISHLPHSLVRAFKATLEEVSGSDLLLHVIDASHPDLEQHVGQVDAVLQEIGADALPVVRVLNKIDRLPPAARGSLSTGDGAVAVSAVTGEGLDDLRTAIGAAFGVAPPVEVLLPAGAGRIRAWLYGIGAVEDEQVREDGSLALVVRTGPDVLERLARQPRVMLQRAQGLPKLSGPPRAAHQMEQL